MVSRQNRQGSMTLPGFTHAVWWRMSRGPTSWLWVAGALLSAYEASVLPRPQMWEGCLNTAITACFPLITVCALVGAVMCGADRTSYLTNRRYSARPFAGHLAVVVACSIQAWTGMAVVSLVVLARFWAVESFRWFSPLEFLVGASWAFAYVAFGACLGAVLPRWISLPVVPIVTWSSAAYLGSLTDSWAGLFAYIHDGFFMAFDDEPRPAVLTAQCLAAAAIGLALSVAPVARFLRRRSLTFALAFFLACVVAATTILAHTGPARTSRHFVQRTVYCTGRVCSIADRTHEIALANAYLVSHPLLLERFDLRATSRLVDTPVAARPGDVRVDLRASDPVNLADTILEALITYHWCGAGEQGATDPVFAPFDAYRSYVTALEKSPNNPPPAPARPAHLTCSTP